MLTAGAGVPGKNTSDILLAKRRGKVYIRQSKRRRKTYDSAAVRSVSRTITAPITAWFPANRKIDFRE